MIHEEMYRYLRRVRSRSEVAMLSLLMPFLLAYMGSSRSHESDECPISDLPACGPRAVCDCSTPLFVNCSSRGLSSVPANLSRELIVLALDNNKLSCIPMNFFQAFYRLSELDISADHIKKSFVLPPSLRILQMEGNRAEDVDNFFQHCNHLTHAMMQGNQIRSIREFAFQKCSKLENLALTVNPFKEIWNNSFKGLTSLQTLRIGGPLLETFHAASISSFCDNLITLEIINSKLLFSLPPSLIRGCRQLKELLIHDTSITELDSNFFSRNSFWKLDLSNNEMTYISSDVFKGIDTVRELYLSFNNMVRIPGLLLQNTSIEYTIDLSNNRLDSIPGELFSANPRGHTVTAVFLSGNRLTTIPPELFQGLHNLEHIFLHGNMIESLPGYFLSGTSTRSLFLFQNFIRNFSMPLFRFVKGNETLEELQLQDNPIEVLSSEVFRGIVKSGNVTLSCDKLTIPPFQEINLKCAPSNLPMVIVSPKVESKLLSSRGFHCVENGVDNLGICTSCSAGTYGDGLLWAKRKCEDCPRGGFYQDQIGQYARDGSLIACKHCNPGTFVMEGAGDSPLSCKVCPSGTNKSAHAGFRACFCLENYFRRDRFGRCELCPVNGVRCQDEYVTIKENYYWNWSYTDIEYYKRFVANVKTLNNSYRKSTSSLRIALPMVHKCLKNDRCANNLDGIEGNCAEGYAGWMCTSCDKGYFPIFGFCHKCPKIAAFIAEVSAILLLFAFALLMLMKYPHRKSAGRSLMDIALARGKIVLGFYQIMGEFWESIDVIFWPELFKSIGSWLDFLQFNISSILIKPSCFNPSLTLTPYSAFVLGSLLPYFVMAVTACSILTLKLRANYQMKHHPERKVEFLEAFEKHRNTILTAATLVLFVTYASTCNVTFELYGPTCDKFSLDEQRAHNISILRSDYSISCATSKHRNFQIAAYVASVYVFAFPAVLFFILRKYSAGDRIATVVGTDDSVTQQRSYPGCLRFLVENYKPRYWFWEIIELVRKISQTFVIILFGWNSSLSITITLTLSVIFLTLHCSFSPMEDRFEHHLQLASLWAIFCNMLVAAVPFPDSFDEYASIMSVFLILVNIGVIGILVVTTILKILRFVYNTEIFRCFRNCLSDVDPLPINEDEADDQLLIN